VIPLLETKYILEWIFRAQISPDSFIVNFQGNSYSKTDKMTKYAIRRASELCLQNGYKYFKIINTLDTSNYSGSSGSLAKAPAFSLRVKCSTEKTTDTDEVEAKFFLKIISRS
jgi:hypothetical protein